jgi:arsenate reductase (glutaredoxin)
MLRSRYASRKDELLRVRVTIFHNLACGTSPNALALMRATGVEPEVVKAHG